MINIVCHTVHMRKTWLFAKILLQFLSCLRSVHVHIYQVRIIILMENYAGTRPGDRVRE